MHYCPSCSYEADGGWCYLCDRALEPKPEPPREEIVLSSAWLGEAEAALTHLMKARGGTRWDTNWTAWKELYIAEGCLKTAIASERSHSPSIVLSNPPCDK